ncbi:divergent protein kinase domain 2B isoform 1 precursor [Homo sapiens]|uniref:Divergent protein kinase domain 2B n=2 Tax=Homo sapiens TaxID=9606 RepID=DIK2B_HUMAN|nr:divergent protein kinase domain 2B isoform 1 precursor [Homo sapiens]Q9H7Y0.3 RecName: Full=Divergent protein kinase domain 2B; AltName: Full=Deleted in autism-related protein 1; Flags: Precursor [Homo sapiens]KAI2599168.1 divergent protein kinase domain 2B [Homo sapiens]|eukprot:NP_789789.2 deleted in autism-related protein 1 isoform 1 precursor [Homo sapiens]
MEPQLGPEAAALRPGWLALLLWVSALSCSFSLPASSLSSLVPQVRTSYNFGRTFLGLDKCNACIGTSICKKFFKEEIRSDNWLASHLGLPPDSLLSYPANYSDDSKIWRPVEIFRLVSKYQNEISDRRICASASAPKTCSIERVLRKTERFQKWLQAKRLTPDLVQGLASPLLRCPSQRLLDRVVRRYAEVADAGSIFMDHFTDRDKLRLLYTLAVNSHPILLQIFPGAEGWPLPKYLGSCGRFLVSTSTRPLQEFYDAPPDQAADLAYQLLGVLESLRSNDLNYFFYFTHIDAGMFGVFNNGHLFIRDASAVGVIDKQEGSQEANRAGENKDIFSCLVSGCQAQLPSCESISEKQSLVLVCQKLLPRLLQGRFPSPVQDDIDSILVQCGDSIRPDPEVLGAASQLKDILRPLRTCDSRFAYRYPDCKYNDKF